MSTVVDLGCASYTHSSHDSISILVDRFAPDRVYGFDPMLGEEPATDASGPEITVGPWAAWIWDGLVEYIEDGVASSVCLDGSALLPAHMQHEPRAPRSIICFDLAEWLFELPGGAVVMKMDVEGAEFVLLPWLLATGALTRVKLLLLEWHTQTRDRDAWRTALEPKLRQHCDVEEWAY